MELSTGRLARLSSTFSIVAFDPETKDLGVGVQSRYFSVGSAVPWAEPGIGAVATQSFVNLTYGPKGLAFLEQGLAVDEILERLTKGDTGRDFRQVGIVDAKGNAASYTGRSCLEWAGSRIGKGFAVQGNILTGKEVVDGMVEMYESTKGALPDRIMAALKGAETAGGDARGRQSSALLIVRKNCKGEGVHRLIDLRVEDHKDPIGELQRLLTMHRLYRLIDESEEFMARGMNEDAMRLIEEAITLNPKSDDAYIDLGMINLKMGRKEEAIIALKIALKLNPRMKSLIPQLPKSGMMEADPELMKRLGL
jgi:uncharacterized Ntn-hydrolase superfamily protein